MKKLLIITLLSALPISAQIAPKFTESGDLILPKEQIIPIADSLKKHEKCELVKKQLKSIIDELSSNMIKTLDSLDVIRQERDNLYEEGLKLQYDLGKQEAKQGFWNSKWFWMIIGGIGGGYLVKELND